jgi:hypothetical protein
MKAKLSGFVDWFQYWCGTFAGTKRTSHGFSSNQS